MRHRQLNNLLKGTQLRVQIKQCDFRTHSWTLFKVKGGLCWHYKDPGCGSEFRCALGCFHLGVSSFEKWAQRGETQHWGQSGSRSWGPDCTVPWVNQPDFAMAEPRDWQDQKWWSGWWSTHGRSLLETLPWIHPITGYTVTPPSQYAVMGTVMHDLGQRCSK